MTPKALLSPAGVRWVVRQSLGAASLGSRRWLDPSVTRASVRQQFDQPAPADWGTLNDALDALQGVEVQCFAGQQRDSRAMVTRLRKLYYAGFGWDHLLVPGTWRVRVPYRPAPDGHPPPGQDAVARAQRHQEIRLPSGVGVDLGHVLAGLDARNHRGPVGCWLLPLRLASNVDACTWLGDLGSVLALMCDAVVATGRELDAQAVQQFLDLGHPSQDFEGNIDGLLIGSADPPTLGDQRATELLADYYAQPPQNRYRLFADKLQLGPKLPAGAFANEAAWTQNQVRQLRHAAALFALSTAMHSARVPLARTLAADPSVEPVAELVLQLFLDGLASQC